MKNHKGEPTHISLVDAVLISSNDFMNIQQLSVETRLSEKDVRKSLWSLRNYHAADLVSDANGTWWFATPEWDTRQHTQESRVPETKPRRKSLRSRRVI